MNEPRTFNEFWMYNGINHEQMVGRLSDEAYRVARQAWLMGILEGSRREQRFSQAMCEYRRDALDPARSVPIRSDFLRSPSNKR